MRNGRALGLVLVVLCGPPVLAALLIVHFGLDAKAMPADVVARAVLACRRAGIDVVGARAPRWYEPRDLYSLAREVVALPVYAITGR